MPERSGLDGSAAVLSPLRHESKIGVFCLKLRLIAGLLALFPIFLPAGRAEAVDRYMPDVCANLQACFQLMSPNDTLIIRDGTYTGASNTILDTAGKYPPNGTGAAAAANGGYTVIRAENEGKVTFDGQKNMLLFYLNAGEHGYLIFRGVKFINPSNTTATRDAIGVYQDCNCHHIKFIRVGAMVSDPQGSGAAFALYAAEDMLLEESYAWGEARYGVILSRCDRIVVRRCVVRLDAAYGAALPVALFQSYTSKNVEWQNNIGIDSDSAYYTNFSYIGAAFSTRKQYDHTTGTYFSENNIFRGNIAFKIHHYNGGSYESPTDIGPAYEIANDGSPALPNILEHNVAWDVSSGIRWTGSPNSVPRADHMSIYVPPDANNKGFGVSHVNMDIKDSVIIGGDLMGIGNGAVSDYNVLYGAADDYANGSVPGGNDKTIDKGNQINPLYDIAANPDGGIRYIATVERPATGHNLSNISSTGGHVGAQVIYRYGGSGKLWGEAGDNTLTTEQLWPFPYEDQIREDFRTYNPGGADPSKPDGKRGFCADNQNLTNYIWRHLGFTPPVFNINASAGNTQATLSWINRAINSPITGYKVYNLTTGTPVLLTNITSKDTNFYKAGGLTNDTAYTFAVTAVDGISGESSYHLSVSATPKSRTPRPPAASFK